MFKVGIIGYGALGQQLEGFILEQGIKEDEIVVFDDATNEISDRKRPFNDYLNQAYCQLDFYIGLGYQHLEARDSVIDKLLAHERKLPVFIHHSAYVHPSASIEPGCFVYPMCCIDQNVRLHRGVLVNNNVCISHDSSVGNCCFIAPSVTLCGSVEIGSYCFIGAGVTISNNIKTGNNCTLAIGTIATKNMGDNQSLIGHDNTILNKRISIR
ncbi:MAG: hypothetical protein MI866_02685 [Bacteroidales bacterium]|nr:hypothetical protein [Bacteroidales bacterium]